MQIDSSGYAIVEFPDLSSRGIGKHSLVFVGSPPAISDMTEKFDELSIDALSKEVLERKRAQEKSEEALRLRDEFFSAVSHELRNPLNALHLTLDGLIRMQSANTPPSSEQIVSRINRAAVQVKRLAKLVDDMLDVSRISAGRLQLRMEEVEVSSLVNEVAVRWNEQVGTSQISVSAPDLVTLYSDRMRLDQVVSNLLANAVTYGRGNSVEVRLESADTNVRLEITDHGIGIAPGDQERIFERFERIVKGPQQMGFGIGLWIARETVHALRGQISVTSELGAGSTFVVELPRLTPAETAITPEAK